MNRVRSLPGWFAPVLLFLALVACVFSMPKPALATPNVPTGNVTSATSWINKIINTTPGINTISVTGTGVSVAAAGDTAVVARGLTIPIAATAATTVTAGRIAGIVSAGLKVGSFVGMAAVIAPWLLDQAGLKVCPPPDFFCKPGNPQGVDPTGTTGYRATAVTGHTFYAGTESALCDKVWADEVAAFPSERPQGPLIFFVYKQGSGATYSPGYCTFPASTGNSRAAVYYSAPTCPAGSSQTTGPDGLLQCTKAGPDVPATTTDIGNATEAAITNQPTRIQFLYGGLQAANAPIFSPGDPVTITPKQVTTTPPTEVTTNTVPKADGSIDTVKVETKTDVKPVVSGTTLGDTKVDYPTTVTTTTTTTNNVTNVTTVTTSVTNIYATPATKTTDNVPDRPTPSPLPNTVDDVAAAKGPNDMPTDYNREVTQKSVLAELQKLNGPITAVAPTGDNELSAITTENNKRQPAIDGITEASTGLAGWFPTIPTAACVNPQVPNPITGVNLAVPICDKVDVFRLFISSVICVFALFGCVREVQSALKA